MSPEHPDLARQAADPATDWTTLHWIAENCPELRPAVAENPSTYTALVDALAALGDPQIDAALVRRAGGEPSDEAPPEPGTGASAAEDPADPVTDRIDTVPGAAAAPGTSSEVAPGPARRASSTARRTTRMPPPSWDAIIAPAHAQHSADDADRRDAAPRPRASGPPEPRSQYHRTRRRVGIALLAVVLPLVVLGSIGALLLNILGGYGPQWTGFGNDSGSGDQGQGSPEQESDGEASEEGSDAEDSPDGQAREELQGLAASSTCSAEDDAEVFTAFADASSGGSWEEDDDGELIESTLLDLEEECGQTHAAAVYLQLTTPDDADEALSGTLEAMGTDWIRPTHPAPAAAELTAFASPDGNVVCEFDEAVRCRVLNQTFPLPEGCDSDTTLAIYADQEPGPDCDNPVPQEDQQTLGYGQSAANEFFACTSFQSQMSCWNQLNGEGFNLQSGRGTTY